MDGSENTGEALRDGYVYVAEGFDASIRMAHPEGNGVDNGGIASSSSEISSISLHSQLRGFSACSQDVQAS
tara:strand:- start:7280 stop:7492 length:213 start_codon:yes stop_codon:yes gene_type:complete